MAQAPSTKHSLIDKANTTIVIATAAAAFIAVFSLVASKALLSQAGYQNRVINAKREANGQLDKNITASQNLVSSYQAFVGTPQNLIGGNPTGTGDKDGDNAKIVLDALPSKYDFPALASSLEKLLTSPGLKIDTITGTDDQLTQGDNAGSSSPTAVPMPFTIGVDGDYGSLQNLVNTFQQSIRPFQFETMTLSGNQNDLALNITAQTYYQPPRTFSITTKVIK